MNRIIAKIFKGWQRGHFAGRFRRRIFDGVSGLIEYNVAYRYRQKEEGE